MAVVNIVFYNKCTAVLDLMLRFAFANTSNVFFYFKSADGDETTA